MPNPSTTLRVSLFSDPGNPRRVFSAVSESALGSTAWHAVSLDDLKRPLSWEYSRLLFVLSQEDDQDDLAREIGKNIFDTFFADPMRGKLQNARAQGSVRIAIDAAVELADIPWELLHDGNDFLLRQDCSVIRVVSALPRRTAYFGPVSRVAVVSVTPDFDATQHLERLSAKLVSLGVTPHRCVNPNRATLKAFLAATQSVEALYFLGHGTAGQLLVDDSDWLDAGDMAQWLPPPSARIKLAYFSSCGTAERRPNENTFSGVAQRLLLSDRVGTVVAMQAKVSLEESVGMAESFFEDWLGHGDPEAALGSSRTLVSNIWARSIPVLYTHVDGPSEFERNRLSCLLGLARGGHIGVSLPKFNMGLKKEDFATLGTRVRRLVGARYHYPGPAYAQDDVSAVKNILDLLGRVASVDAVEIVGDDAIPDCPVTFFFGSRSHDTVPAALSLAAEGRQFRFEYSPSEWAIVDVAKGDKRYMLSAPDRPGSNYAQQVDWGIIEKIAYNGRSLFFMSGLGDRATRGCAYFFARNWETLLSRHRDRPFAELITFPGGLDHTMGHAVERH